MINIDTLKNDPEFQELSEQEQAALLNEATKRNEREFFETAGERREERYHETYGDPHYALPEPIITPEEERFNRVADSMSELSKDHYAQTAWARVTDPAFGLNQDVIADIMLTEGIPYEEAAERTKDAKKYNVVMSAVKQGMSLKEATQQYEEQQKSSYTSKSMEERAKEFFDYFDPEGELPQEEMLQKMKGTIRDPREVKVPYAFLDSFMNVLSFGVVDSREIDAGYFLDIERYAQDKDNNYQMARMTGGLVGNLAQMVMLQGLMSPITSKLSALSNKIAGHSFKLAKKLSGAAKLAPVFGVQATIEEIVKGIKTGEIDLLKSLKKIGIRTLTGGIFGSNNTIPNTLARTGADAAASFVSGLLEFEGDMKKVGQSVAMDVLFSLITGPGQTKQLRREALGMAHKAFVDMYKMDAPNLSREAVEKISSKMLTDLITLNGGIDNIAVKDLDKFMIDAKAEIDAMPARLKAAEVEAKPKVELKPEITTKIKEAELPKGGRGLYIDKTGKAFLDQGKYTHKDISEMGLGETAGKRGLIRRAEVPEEGLVSYIVKPDVMTKKEFNAAVRKDILSTFEKAGYKEIITSYGGDQRIFTIEGMLKGAEKKPILKRYTLGKVVGKDEFKRATFEFLEIKKFDIQTMKKELIAYSKINLPKAERSTFMTRIENIKTRKDFENVVKGIDDYKLKVEKNLSWKTLQKTGSRIKSKIKEFRAETRPFVESILNGLDLKNTSEGKLSRVKELANQIENMNEGFYKANPIVQKEYLDNIKLLEGNRKADLTLEEINDIDFLLSTYEKMNKQENMRLTKEGVVSMQNDIDNANNNIKVRADKKKISLDEVPALDATVKLKKKKGILTGLLNPEEMTRTIDGKREGIVQKLMHGDIRAGIRKKYILEYKAQDALQKTISDLKLTDNQLKKMGYSLNVDRKDVDITRFKLNNGQAKLTKANMMEIYLNSKSFANLKAMVDDGVVLKTNPYAKPLRLSIEDIYGIIDGGKIKFEHDGNIVEWKGLTKAEKKIADTVGEIFNTHFKDGINEVSMVLYGKELALEENFFPIERVPLDIKTGAGKTPSLTGVSKDTATTLLEAWPHLISRKQGAKGAIYLGDIFSTLAKHTQFVSSFNGLAVPLRNAKIFLSDAKMQRNIVKVFGDDYIKYLDEYIRDIEGRSIDVANIEKMGIDFIDRASLSMLAFNPIVMIKQPISLLNAMVEIEAGYIIRGMLKNIKLNPNAIFKKLKEIGIDDVMIRRRMDGGFSHTTGDIKNAGYARKMALNKATISDRLMQGVRRGDGFAIATIYDAVTIKGKKLGWSKETILKNFDEIVRRTQPTYEMTERSALARKKGYIPKILTRFTTQRNKNVNMIHRALDEFYMSNRKFKDVAKLAKDLGILTVAVPLTMAGINRARNELLGRKKPKKDLGVIGDLIEQNLGNIYMAGDFVTSLRSFLERGLGGGFEYDNMVDSSINEFSAFIYYLKKGIEQGINKPYLMKKGKRQWLRSINLALKNLTSLTGKLTGLPLSNIRRYAEPFVKFGKKKKRGY